MGCDIHMYAEKINPKTSGWEKIGSQFIDSNMVGMIVDYMSKWYGLTEDEAFKIVKKYYQGYEASDNLEKKVYKDIEKRVTDDPNFDWWNDQSKLPNPKTDKPFYGRNYRLFGALAGVRDYNMETISDFAKGLPVDVSTEVCGISDEWGVDGHSHSYLTVKELIDSKYYKMSEKELHDIGMGMGTYFFKDVVDSLLRLGNPEDVRIVFWFDN